MIYTIKAYWPNITSEPYVKLVGCLADAINEVVRLAMTGEHTIIKCLTPDHMEIITMWGQLKEMPLRKLTGPRLQWFALPAAFTLPAGRQTRGGA